MSEHVEVLCRMRGHYARQDSGAAEEAALDAAIAAQQGGDTDG